MKSKLTAPEIAQRWAVSLRTAQQWRKTNVPAHDEAEMVAWYRSHSPASQKRFDARFRAKIGEARVRLKIDVPAKQAAPGATAAPRTDQQVLTELKRLRDVAISRLSSATESSDMASIAEQTRQIEHLSAVVHDEELRAHKLGRELGEIMERGEVERFVRSEKWWRLRGIDHALASVIPKLIAAGAAAPLTRDSIVNVLEPALLDETLVKPMEGALRGKGMALPEWFVAIQREALGDLIEPAESTTGCR
jgi:hypothetical protein